MSEPYWSALAGGFVDYIGPWAAGTTYAPGAVVSYNGINYLAVNPSTGVVPSGGLASDIGLVLPTAPFDGQEFTLVDSLTAATYAWKFRYVAARATNKWLFIGGAPAWSEVATNENVNSTTYVAAPTPGPSVVVPVAGDYQVGIGFRRAANVAAGGSFMSYDIGGTAAVDADAVMSTLASGGDALHSVFRVRRKSLTAVTLTAKYRHAAAGAEGIADRWMQVTPIAVGG